MLLTETFSYQIGTIKTRNGNNMRVAYIDAHRSQDTYGIRKQIQSYGAKWEPTGKWWYWPLGNNPEEVIQTQVRPCIEYLTKIEDMGGDPKRNVEDVINKLISKLKTASMPTVKGGSSKDDILASLERFKEDLVKITSDEEFKRMMEPIIKFRNANNYQYSLLNTLLILVQDPKATLVKSGGAWRDYYQRTVKPGAKPIMMWIPKGKRAYTDEEREEVISSFLRKKKVKAITDLSVPDKETLDKKLGRTIPESFDLAPYWYDYRFTEQKPNTEDILGNPGDNVQWFDDSGDETPELVKKIDATLAVIEEEGITLSFVDKIGSGDARGVSKSGSIEILQNQPKNAGMLNTIIHEFAHEILHQSYLKSKNEEMKEYFVGTNEGRGKVEQQAELCAWIVMRSFGYDMKTNINYVGIWGLNQDNAVRVFDSVSKVATLITQKINKKEQGVPMEESKKYLRESNIPSGEEIANMVGCGEIYQRAKKHMMRTTMENVVLDKNKNKNKSKNMNKKNTIKLTESELKNIISESVNKILKEEFGVDMEDTLSWVRKKKPNMSPEEQQRFAQNIINKRNRDSKGVLASSGPTLSTYDEVRKAVIEYMSKNWPEDYEKGVTHYKASLKALGFRNNGYDMYGANAYTNGKVRVAVYYDRGEGYWEMEEAQGYSATTDNFYNTSSEMRDSSGVYGRGSIEDPWNR